MNRGDLLLRALTDAGDPPLRPLPDRVADLLKDLGAPPRLAAHLRAVHDVACQLTGWMAQHRPEILLDRDAVAFGAATHDIGKTVHAGELSGPGSAHEQAGRDLLLARGISPQLARFAATHSSWSPAAVGLEDLMVSLADNIWKDKRVPDLEDLVVRRLAAGTGREPWEEFLALDDLLTGIGSDSARRLAFQAAFPVD